MPKQKNPAPSPAKASPAPNARGARTGTQAIERAALILRELSSRGRFGWRPSDLAERCQLDCSTTQRILAALVRERLVHQRASDRHYMLGQLVYEMSLAMADHAQFQAACAPALRRLSRTFGALALMHLHSDTDSVCIGRCGESVYVGTSMEIGTRWPLIASAGGVAILNALPAPQRERIQSNNYARMASRTSASVRAIENMITRSQTLGFAFNRGETAPGVHAFALPVRSDGTRVLGSVALALHAQQVPPGQEAEVVAALRNEVHGLQDAARRLQQLRDGQELQSPSA